MTKKSFTSEFKSKVAVEALKGHRTIAELASEFDIHPTQINNWKKQLLDSSKMAFNGKQQLKAQQNQEEERDRLYAQIGKLKVELDWLKKKVGHLD
jgi:transposase